MQTATGPEPKARDSIRRGIGSKLKIALLVALLFGAPALVTAALLATDFGSAVADAPQPGGRVQGELVDSSGRPVPGIAVALVSVSSSGARAEQSRTKSATDGAFEMRAEATEGHYEIRTGGGDWQNSARAYSFVDSNGKILPPKPLRIELKPGCRLELRFSRADGRAPGDGEFTLQGEYGDGLFFGLVRPRLRLSGVVKDGRLVLDGLPPMRAEVFVKMSSGETVELTLDLASGTNTKAIKI